MDIKSDQIKERKCFRCGKELPLGSLTYLIQIKVLADFDGWLLEPEEGVDRQLKQILEQIEPLDPQDLEKEVYEEITWIVCKSCRDRFIDDIQHPWEGPFRIRKDPDSILH